MDVAEALELVVARTRHYRYRDFFDPDHPDYNPAYTPVILEMAAGLAAGNSPPPRANAVDGLFLVWACDYRGKPTCGCGSKVMCSLKSTEVSHRDCFECVKTLDGDPRVTLDDAAPSRPVATAS